MKSPLVTNQVIVGFVLVSCFASKLSLRANEEKPRSEVRLKTATLVEAANEGDEEAMETLLKRPLAAPDGKPDNQLIGWFRDVAQEGNGRVMCRLGDAYQQAAKSGHAPAMFSLATIYAGGFGVKQDRALAIEWLEQAAALGHPQATEYLRAQERQR